MSEKNDQQSVNEAVYQFFDRLEPIIKTAVEQIIDSNIKSVKKPKKKSELPFHSDAEYQGDKRFLTADKLMLFWNPDTDKVRVFPLEEVWENRLADAFECSTFGCESKYENITFEHRKLLVFIEAMHLIIRDKCDPMAVHRALLNVREYRDGCADDMIEVKE